ncbi:hypothetical protein EJB05_15371, partial [Eragrostis curvula]
MYQAPLASPPTAHLFLLCGRESTSTWPPSRPPLPTSVVTGWRETARLASRPPYKIQAGHSHITPRQKEKHQQQVNDNKHTDPLPVCNGHNHDDIREVSCLRPWRPYVPVDPHRADAPLLSGLIGVSSK